jgi:hypothetical protein
MLQSRSFVLRACMQPDAGLMNLRGALDTLTGIATYLMK